MGPSGQDPVSRVTVAFAWREDGKSNNLNVIASTLTAAKGSDCSQKVPWYPRMGSQELQGKIPRAELRRISGEQGLSRLSG